MTHVWKRECAEELSNVEQGSDAMALPKYKSEMQIVSPSARLAVWVCATAHHHQMMGWDKESATHHVPA
eukprot:CAMPEP_0181174432 /NCGR_PEP_ID=MMETSP1096-20121128/3532_1 /TAXON_ID=156174 ORGANISM="Chrysochromulina ericina, Strain CCMP281" /NCGR_SAMPLE_ID=MMETSP1096 /ASSEMBLY_ACC=CAM_ASM_000453 /LENGTH=68 /DNA_ID=CAMNT_0023262331 /DNA_START=60 /DNA_END=266 /DNA_ORIENTATION=-